jgi:hypothetical protein
MHRIILILSVLLGSWLGMQTMHESGHAIAAMASGGRVEKVVLCPLTISRTDLAHNPQPLFVVWAGPVFGVVAPMILWGVAVGLNLPGAFVLRFFAGFCLIANGAYIGIGSFDNVGDCGTMLRHGSSPWQLWLFGAVTVPFGLWLWHRQGVHFGLETPGGQVDPRVAYCSFGIFIALLVLPFLVDGE